MRRVIEDERSVSGDREETEEWVELNVGTRTWMKDCKMIGES